uniref:Uncharacterized protein n=1 Tax=viral metagenome TaxID=1070528 RepID=A0A6M3J2U8_9ZZZZ
MKLQTWANKHCKIKNPYLIFIKGSESIVVGQIKVPIEEFWGYMSEWLKDEFGINVKFDLGE